MKEATSTTTTKRPADAQLVKLLRDAANFYEHIYNRQVFKPGTYAALQVMRDAADLTAAADALEAPPVPTPTDFLLALAGMGGGNGAAHYPLLVIVRTLGGTFGTDQEWYLRTLKSLEDAGYVERTHHGGVDRWKALTQSVAAPVPTVTFEERVRLAADAIHDFNLTVGDHVTGTGAEAEHLAEIALRAAGVEGCR